MSVRYTTTQTYSDMLDRAETPLQTLILLGQLAMLRKLSAARQAITVTPTVPPPSPMFDLSEWEVK